MFLQSLNQRNVLDFLTPILTILRRNNVALALKRLFKLFRHKYEIRNTKTENKEKPLFNIFVLGLLKEMCTQAIDFYVSTTNLTTIAVNNTRIYST